MQTKSNILQVISNCFYHSEDSIASPFLWKAFHLSSVCHGAFPFPLKWNPTNKTFSVNPASWQIQCWTVAVIIGIFGMGTIICTFLFINQVYFTDLSHTGQNYTTVFLLLIIAVLSLIGWQVSLTIVYYRHELVLFFNSALAMEQKITGNVNKNLLSLKDHYIGATVLYVVFVFVIFPYTSVPVAVAFRMDPLSYFLHTYFPHFFPSYPVLSAILRYTVILFLNTTTVLIASQSYAFILLYMTTTLLTYSKLLPGISRIAPLEARLRSYKMFFILHQIYAAPAAIASGVSLTVGFILSIMLAIVGIQGYDKFPLIIYLYSALTEGVIFMLVSILLPSTFQVYEQSRQMIRLDWKRDLERTIQGKRRRGLVREIKALSPAYFGFYRILKLTQSWGAAYVFHMMDKIMDGNLTFSLD